MTSLRPKTTEILENHVNMNPREIVEYLYDNNYDEECRCLYDSLPEDFQEILNKSADDWKDEIQRQRDEIQRQHDEIHEEIIACQDRTKIAEALNEEVLRRIELNRIEMTHLGLTMS